MSEAHSNNADLHIICSRGNRTTTRLERSKDGATGSGEKPMTKQRINTAEEAEALSLKYPEVYAGEDIVNWWARYALEQANGDPLVAEDMPNTGTPK